MTITENKLTPQKNDETNEIDKADKSSIIVISSDESTINTFSKCISEEQQSMNDIFLLDFGDEDFIVPYNPLDVHTNGQTPQKAALEVFDVWKSIWPSSWADLTESALKYALLAIAAHNASQSPKASADGLSMLGVFLNSSPKRRKQYLTGITDECIRTTLERYFNDDFNSYNNTLREKTINPILSKAYLFQESPMLEFFSAPHSIFNPAYVIANKKALLINTRMNEYDPDIFTFFSTLLVNSLLEEIQLQHENFQKTDNIHLLIIDENLPLKASAIRALHVCDTILIHPLIGRNPRKTKQYKELLKLRPNYAISRKEAIEASRNNLRLANPVFI